MMLLKRTRTWMWDYPKARRIICTALQTQLKMSDAALARSWSWWWSARGIWLVPVAFVLSLLGTELLHREPLRPWAMLLLLAAGVLAILAWNDAQRSPPFPGDRGAEL